MLARATSSDDAKSPHSVSEVESQQFSTTSYAQDRNLLSEFGISRQQELQLMVCYMNKTSQTLAHDGDDLVAWRETIPEEAIQHHFLMDGLLAMAALHFAYENPNSRSHYTQVAIRYQNSSLQVYNRHLGNINEENCTALFAYSVLVNLMAIAFPNTSSDSAPSSHTEGIMTMLELIRGIGLIHNSTSSIYRSGKLGSFYRDVPTNIRPDDETEAALERLRQRSNTLLASESIDGNRHSVYLSSIHSLEVAFAFTTVSSHLGRIMGWPASLQPSENCEKLMNLFKHGDVMTQLIYMYYGVLLLHTRHRWWGQRTGASLIQHLAISVRAAGPDWAVETKWPMEMAKRAAEKDGGIFAQQDS